MPTTCGGDVQHPVRHARGLQRLCGDDMGRRLRGHVPCVERSFQRLNGFKKNKNNKKDPVADEEVDNKVAVFYGAANPAYSEFLAQVVVHNTADRRRTQPVRADGGRVCGVPCDCLCGPRCVFFFIQLSDAIVVVSGFVWSQGYNDAFSDADGERYHDMNILPPRAEVNIQGAFDIPLLNSYGDSPRRVLLPGRSWSVSCWTLEGCDDG